ncbi:GMC family oxidoreductase [Burkholderia cenocepacia]|uniref:GMC family oxidoreductase n=2 Tax=Burkholderia cenocepacia TaxID=95486 RepID=UPI001BABBE91|nr:GMC family oxidoreductase N-terminal domain-containing protein [Burkholderia cenocepacia]QUO29422.1 GMC family oxidoreductase N-terminal domain-containing protein [Burkholderia cenocepacia]
MTNAKSSYDHIVVGAGSSGCVLVRRLLDAGRRVLLIEAGPSDDKPEIHDPMGSMALWNSEVDWAFSTEPQVYANGQRLPFPRGKTLGGSSAFNGMIYVRGARQDFDTWSYLGNAGWDYDSVLPHFKRFERFDDANDAIHGVQGELPITLNPRPTPVTLAFLEAARATGLPLNRNYNDGNAMWGAYHTWITVEHNRRMSSWVAFLEQEKDNYDLTVIVDARVVAVEFDGDRAVGVRYVVDGRTETAFAEHDIVLSAGSLCTPQLLMLSGIGPAGHLRDAGIRVRVDLPGVGENLQDHVNVPLVWESPKPVPVSGAQGLEATLFWKSHPDMIVPDMQPILITFPYPGADSPEHGFTIVPTLVHPHSRGVVRLRSSDPFVPPLIDPCFLKDPRDLESLVTQIEFIRDIVECPEMDGWRKRECAPGVAVKTREALAEFVRRNAVSDHHQVGTAKMGVDTMAVVDPELRVYGTRNLRVVDGSIMPLIVTGNTNGACLMIGDKAADLILASA